MQKWKSDKDSVLWTAEDGEWVEAEVAQQLYDALQAYMREHKRYGAISVPTIQAGMDALAAADGDSHEDAQA